MTTPLTMIDVDAIINVVEINDRHGVGILLQRIFKNRAQTISIRTLNLYGGEQSFGIYDVLIGRGISRSEITAKVKQELSGYNIRRILCVPYHEEEICIALALHELFGADICTYLMDDQNVSIDAIDDSLMAELLDRSTLCLAISPEMRDVYQFKYKVPIHFVPPIIPSALMNDKPTVLLIADRVRMGTILGNIWSPKWLELLRTMTRETGLKLDWYGNTGADWYFNDRQKLGNDGIIECGFLPTEAEVVETLRNYAYIVVPSGMLDSYDDNLATSWLSLPSRIPFVLATVNIPIIVLGNPSTAAARFVTRLGIGTVTDYDPVSFQAAVAYVTQPSVQQQMRANAARIAPHFVNEQMDEWIWQSLKLGKPIDDRFDKIFCESPDYLASFTTCLELIRQQQAEIDRLSAKSKFISTSIGKYKRKLYQYLKKIKKF
jgi:hypothetical protein